MAFKEENQILHSVNSSWDSEWPGSWHCLMYVWPFEVVEILYVYIMLSCDIFKAFDLIVQLTSHKKLFVFVFVFSSHSKGEHTRRWINGHYALMCHVTPIQDEQSLLMS